MISLPAQFGGGFMATFANPANYKRIARLQGGAWSQIAPNTGMDATDKNAINKLCFDEPNGVLLIGGSFNVFDVNGKKTNVENLELNGTINYKFLLELTDLWYDNDTCLCGCNFNITQIKHFPLYYEYDLIIDENNYECQGKGKGLGTGTGTCNGKSFQPLLTPPPPKACIPINCDINSTTIEVSKDITPITQNKPINFVLDANMLKNALSKLKKPPI